MFIIFYYDYIVDAGAGAAEGIGVAEVVTKCFFLLLLKFSLETVVMFLSIEDGSVIVIVEEITFI